MYKQLYEKKYKECLLITPPRYEDGGLRRFRVLQLSVVYALLMNQVGSITGPTFFIHHTRNILRNTPSMNGILFIYLPCPSGHYILMKVFSLHPWEKSANFLRSKDRQFIHHLVLVHRALWYIAITGVGYCLFASRLCRASPR